METEPERDGASDGASTPPLTRVAIGGAGTLLLVPLVIMTVSAFGMEGFSRTYALALLGPLTILLAGYVALTVLKPSNDADQQATDASQGHTPARFATTIATVGFAFLWGIYAYTWSLVGFIVATTAALSCSVALLGWRRWAVLPGAAVLSFALYWVLSGPLAVAIPRGPLEQAVTDILRSF